MGKRKKKKQNSPNKQVIKELAKKLAEQKITSKSVVNESVEEHKELQGDVTSKEELELKKNVNSTINVRNYRERLKALGFKQVSIYLPPSTYEKLKFLRLHTNKSYADIIERLIEEEYKSFKKRKDINFLK